MGIQLPLQRVEPGLGQFAIEGRHGVRPLPEPDVVVDRNGRADDRRVPDQRARQLAE